MWRQVWVCLKMFRDNGSKMGKGLGEFVDEGRKEVSGIAQILGIPPAEEGASKLPSFLKTCADRMG